MLIARVNGDLLADPIRRGAVDAADPMSRISAKTLSVWIGEPGLSAVFGVANRTLSVRGNGPGGRFRD